MIGFIDDSLHINTFEDAYGCSKDSKDIGENITAGASMSLANAGKSVSNFKPSAQPMKFDTGSFKKTVNDSSNKLANAAKEMGSVKPQVHESVDVLCDPDHYPSYRG